MSSLPFLIIQPRRLGDLILTFPLILELTLRWPGQPIWIAAKKTFYRELVPLAPEATFFPVEQLPHLAKREYQAVINLGSDPAAASCTAECRAQLKLGRALHDGKLRINGFWQLYRESLTHNNYHNRFHWADLFRLDLGSTPARLERPAPKAAESGRIGLFVGASEPGKRPQAQFWAALANRLAVAGFRPVLLGGPDEIRLGADIMAKKPAAINFCGKTSLAQLAGIMHTLDLLITPDTGPMHLADWLGTPVLNLSMGNVSAYETGPLSAGQHVATAAMSCYGCWQCRQRSLLCHSEFRAGRIAQIAEAIARDKKPEKLPGLRLFKTARDEQGLYVLKGERRGSLGEFWQAAFLAFANGQTGRQQIFRERGAALSAENEQLAAHMRANFSKMLGELARASKDKSTLTPAFWASQPRHSRLFAGNLQMLLQNGDYSPDSFRQALERIDMAQRALTTALAV